MAADMQAIVSSTENVKSLLFITQRKKALCLTVKYFLSVSCMIYDSDKENIFINSLCYLISYFLFLK